MLTAVVCGLRAGGWQWFAHDADKVPMLRRVRAVQEAIDRINKAPLRAKAKTKFESQVAREEAAPTYLRARVRTGGPLPMLQVSGERRGVEDEERQVVCEYVVRGMKEELFAELMEGLRYNPIRVIGWVDPRPEHV